MTMICAPMTCAEHEEEIKEVAVATRQWILVLLPVALIAALAGCGGGSTFNVQNPQPPTPSDLAIAFQAAPPQSILVGTSMSLTAVVSNDPSNAGVDWLVSCNDRGNCGTLSAPHTASGAAVTYMPPASFAGNSQAVNIVAYATEEQTKNVVASINITAFGSSLKGRYVLQAQGADSSSNLYQFTGLLVLDGNGGVTSGEQTVNFSDPATGFFVSKTDTINSVGSNYFVGPDGRGTITIVPNDSDIGTLTFSFVFLSSSQALISEFSTSTSTISVSGTGTMDSQTWTNTSPALSGGYAFVVNGSDFSSGSPTAFGGILNIDSPNNISGKGSVTDQNFAGTLAVNQKLSGTVSNPDSFGAVQLSLTVPGFPSTTAYEFTGYLVDSAHIKLIESDNPPGTGGIGSTIGVAISQGSATGTFNNTSFSGLYVFGVLGQDLFTTAPSTLTSAGVFSADGGGNLINGFTDTLLQATPAQISAAFTGAYSVAATGRVRSSFSHFAPHPPAGFNPGYFFYLTGNGNAPVLVLAAAKDNQSNPLLVGAGIAYMQSSGSLTLSGDYGFGFTQQNGSEYDGTAQMSADSTTTPISLAGIADVSAPGGGVQSDQPFSGTLNSPCLAGLAGCVIGTLENTGKGNAFVSPNRPLPVDFYVIDSDHGFFVETDLLSPNNPSGVVALGNYVRRTPVCPSCQ
jgi:hypothetical protein